MSIKSATKSFRIRNIFVKYNREYNWMTIQHDWNKIVVEHRWTWGFGQPIRYYRTWLPF